MQTPIMAQHQQMRPLPVQIQASTILNMNSIELGEFLDNEALENPALSVDEKSRCELCGFLKGHTACPVCGASDAASFRRADAPLSSERDYLERAYSAACQPEVFDPFRTIASESTLREYLLQQARMALGGRKLRIAEFLIDSLDEDGYFRESMYETAESFAAAVPEIESVLQTVQSFDPPGIGARDLRECLLLQLHAIEPVEESEFAQRILSEHWDDFSKAKLKNIAASTGAALEEVRGASEFIRENLTPRPSSLFCAPHAELTPRETALVVPDVVIRPSGNTFVAEVIDRHTRTIQIDETYQKTHETIRAGSLRMSDEDKKHVREQVDRVKCILDSIHLRKQTLARVAGYLADHQRDFIARGPLHLKTLRQKDVAHALGLHESTICRALANKHCLLPSGETISFEVFFDSALPIRNMISRIVATSTEPLSDSEIMRRLASDGVTIARRTVAKYRDQLRVPAYQLRAA